MFNRDCDTVRSMSLDAVRRQCAALLLFLAFAGLVARALIPAGFMPDVTQSGSMAMVICSGVSEKLVYLDDDGTVHDAPVQKAAAPCDYTLTVHLASLIVPVVALFLTDYDRFAVAASAAAAQYSAPPLPYIARGPPVFSA